ncbi:MAG: TRAM domain-containing protein, partial [Brevibacillus sp.]
MAKTAKKRRGTAVKPELDLPVRLGQTVEVEITGLNHEGAGVGRVDGYTLFVQGALAGERVRARVEHVKKSYGFASLLDVVEASP